MVYEGPIFVNDPLARWRDEVQDCQHAPEQGADTQMIMRDKWIDKEIPWSV